MKSNREKTPRIRSQLRNLPFADCGTPSLTRLQVQSATRNSFRGTRLPYAKFPRDTGL